MRSKPIEVTAAVIWHNQNFLIAQRTCGGWEFPGGKIEVGESAENCLIREIEEELTLKIKIINPLLDYVYNYPDKSIRLISFLAEIVSGVAQPLEHEKIEWIGYESLDNYSFLPADMPIVDLLKKQSYEK